MACPRGKEPSIEQGTPTPYIFACIAQLCNTTWFTHCLFIGWFTALCKRLLCDLPLWSNYKNSRLFTPRQPWAAFDHRPSFTTMTRTRLNRGRNLIWVGSWKLNHLTYLPGHTIWQVTRHLHFTAAAFRQIKSEETHKGARGPDS